MDSLPIIGTLSICFTLFAGNLLKPENYDIHREAYLTKVTAYNLEVTPYYEQYTNGDLTQEEYTAIVEPIEESYFDNEETDIQTVSYVEYLRNSFLFYFLGFNLIYYFYNLFTKGKTLGRRVLKIELKGKINWWTLLLREVIWKTGYWILTLGAGVLVDMFMMGATTKKLSFRDMVSRIRVTQEGIDYPF